MSNFTIINISQQRQAQFSPVYNTIQKCFNDIIKFENITDTIQLKIEKLKCPVSARINVNSWDIQISIDMCIQNIQLSKDMIYAMLAHEFGHYHYKHKIVTFYNEIQADKYCIDLLIKMKLDKLALSNLLQYIDQNYMCYISNVLELRNRYILANRYANGLINTYENINI